MNIKELIKLADSLDDRGFFKEANDLDNIVKLAWFPASTEDLVQREDEAKARLRERGKSEEEIEHILDLVFPERVASFKTANENNGCTILEDIMKTNQDPRVVPDPNGGHMCSMCGRHIPESEIQLGCRYCEEDMNLGFIKDPHGPINPPRLKTPPRIYDRYRQEPPERIDVVDVENGESSEYPTMDTPY